MNYIRTANEFTKNVLFPSGVLSGKYRPSQFNIFFDENGVHYLFNSFFRSLVKLSDDGHIFADNSLIEIDAHNCSSEMIQLIENGFLVPEDRDESKTYMEFMDLYRNVFPSKKGKTFYKIFTTLQCNARCFYCFEPDHSVHHMSEDTVDAVFEYIKKTKTDGRISLYWFGGEPLCNIPAIDQLCEKLEKEGIEFVSSMVTNGFLFSQELAKRAKNVWKLKKAQITLDGMDDEHNKRKRYIEDCPNPFAKTINNIEYLLNEGVFVTLRLNVDSKNTDDIWKLIDYLNDRFADKKESLNVYPALLFEEFFKWRDKNPSESRIELRKQWVAMRARLLDNGLMKLQKESLALPTTHCMSNNPRSAIINYDGKLFACQNCQEDMSYGNVRDGITDPAMYDRWTINTVLRDKCKECALLPECTAFDMCPSKATDCVAEYSDSLIRRLKKYVMDKQSDTTVMT